MAAEGVVVARDQRVRGRRGRGRPAKVFALTDAGRSAFYQAYDDLAVSALRYIRETGGERALQEFARRVATRLEERYHAVAAAAPEKAGTAALAEALSADGYAASVESVRLGEQVCQHHCPVAHVAEQFPELCEAETEVFARLLGRHVQRLATIAHGDGVCTTHVPRTEIVSTLHQERLGRSTASKAKEATLRRTTTATTRRNHSGTQAPATSGTPESRTGRTTSP